MQTTRTHLKREAVVIQSSKTNQLQLDREVIMKSLRILVLKKRRDSRMIG